MKDGSLYRYNIQFPGKTDLEIRAGEFLETLGRKKSTVIIAALNEYLDQIEKIEAAISALDNPMERLVLRYKYLDATTTESRTWREVAEKIYGNDSEAKVRATQRINLRELEHLSQMLQGK